VRCIKDSNGDSGNGDNTELPTITTASVSSITDSSAVSGGIIDTNGGAAITASGVIWNTVSDPTVDTKLGITNEDATSGSFVSNITGLNSGTTYYLRAYATNSEGTAYGVEDTFVTTADLKPTFQMTTLRLTWKHMMQLEIQYRLVILQV
jgi:pectinesterase